jgi:hypothetical protein
LKTRVLAWAVSFLSVLGAANGETVPYYIGVDSLATIASGAYADLANPNLGRLTFLYNHGDHYHAKGAFVYTGPNLGDSTAVAISASNYLPEGSALPFALTPGSGAFAGLYVSGQTPDVPGSSIRIGSVDALAAAPAGSDESILFNSGGGRWTGSLAQAELAIELVGFTAGLSILDASGQSLFGSGTTYALGSGGASLDFAPIFAASAMGDYSASFRLIDTRASGGFGESGVFEYRFTAVPEPSSVILAALGAAALPILARRRRPGIPPSGPAVSD